MKRELLTKLASLVGVRALGALLSIVVTVVLSRKLGAEDFGRYGYLVIIIALISIPVSNGWATLVLRHVATIRTTGEWPLLNGLMQGGARLVLALSGFSACAAFLFLPVLNPELTSIQLILGACLIGVIILLEQLSAQRLAILRGLDQPMLGQLPEIIFKPLVLVGSFLLLSMLPTLENQFVRVVLSLMIATLFCFAVGGFLLRRQLPQNKSADIETRFSQWSREATVLAASTGLIVLNSYVDTLMLGALSDFEQVGYYRVASQLALLSIFFYSALNFVASQRFSLYLAQKDYENLSKTATFMARVSFLTCLPVLIIFLAYGEIIVAAVFGEKYLGSVIIINILLAAQLLNVSFGMPRTLLMMAKKEGKIFLITILCICTNLGLGVVLIPKYDGIGAAIALLVSLTAWNILVWLQCLKEIKIDTSIIGLRLKKINCGLKG